MARRRLFGSSSASWGKADLGKRTVIIKRLARNGGGAGDFDSTQSARRRVPTTFRIRLSTPYLPWPASGLRIENARRWEKGESDHAAQAACEPARRRLNARPAPSHPPARDPAPWAAARAGSSLTGFCPTLPARRGLGRRPKLRTNAASGPPQNDRGQRAAPPPPRPFFSPQKKNKKTKGKNAGAPVKPQRRNGNANTR